MGIYIEFHENVTSPKRVDRAKVSKIKISTFWLARKGTPVLEVMNLVLVLVSVVFYSSSGASSYNEYPTFVTDEDFEHHFFSDELEDTSYTSDSEELREQSNFGIFPTTMDAAKMSFPYSEEEQMEKNRRNKEGQEDDRMNFERESDQFSGHHTPDVAKEEGMADRHLLDQFSKIQQKVYNNYEQSFHNKEKEPNQALIRRDTNTWRDDISEPDSTPWNLDSYHSRHGSPTGQNDYFDDSGYLVDFEQKNVSGTGMPVGMKDVMPRDEPLSYYQKNYYYNYYPPANARKYNKPSKWDDSGEKAQNRENSSGRKLLRKNACKQYLQFLKYAFEKLDENPDYNYDYNEDIEEWKEKGMQKNKVFAVHLLGPTLYVDNSGKVSQINAKGNSYQSVDGVDGASSSLPKALPHKKDEDKPKPTTLPIPSMRTERVTTVPNQNAYDQAKTTTEIPWLNISLKTNLTAPNKTKDVKLNPEIQHRSSFGTRMEEEWRHQIGGEVYETTVRTETEHTVFDEYDYADTKSSLPSLNTYPPKWFPSEEYYRKLAKAMARKNNDTSSNVISSETNAAVGPPLYWMAPSSTPQATTLSPVFAKSPRYETTESSTDLMAKKDDDCNDKMLPCPDTVNVTYPLNGYCNRYVSCESGRAIRRTCPEGLHFNIITRSCDLPHNSFCTYTCPASNGYYGIPGDCGGYFVCKNFTPDYRMCPPRMHWDIKKSTCTFAELSSCPMKCTKANDVKHYEGDCKAYVICLNGIPYYHKCPPNTKFDKRAQTCVPSHQSKCEDDPRLLTKLSNPNHLCREVEIKLGTKIWCNHFFPEESQKSKKHFEK